MSTNEKIKWAASILLGLSGVFALGAVTDVVPPEYHKWVALAVAVTAYAGQWLESRIPARPEMAKVKKALRGVGAPVLALCLLGSTACGPTTWQDAVVRTADAMREATAKTIPELMKLDGNKQLAACKAKQGPERKACLESLAKWLKAWHKARGGLQATIVALDTLYIVYKDPQHPKPLAPPVTPAQPPRATPVQPAMVPAPR